MDMEAISPSRESLPYSLKMSRRRPVAAEEENIFTMVSGTSSPGKPMYAVKWPMIDDRKSRKPEARRIPTATMRPMRVGMIFMTVKKPLFAPLIKLS